MTQDVKLLRTIEKLQKRVDELQFYSRNSKTHVLEAEILRLIKIVEDLSRVEQIQITVAKACQTIHFRNDGISQTSLLESKEQASMAVVSVRDQACQDQLVTQESEVQTEPQTNDAITQTSEYKVEQSVCMPNITLNKLSSEFVTEYNVEINLLDS